MLEAKAKDQGTQSASALQKKKKVFTKIFQAISKKKKRASQKFFRRSPKKNKKKTKQEGLHKNFSIDLH